MSRDRRRHYSDDFRRAAIELIRQGAGERIIARRLAMPVYTARSWIMLYRSIGEEAVMARGGCARYDWQTKVAAARAHVEKGMTKTEVMARYRLGSLPTLERWCRQYRQGGPEALRPRRRGRPRGARNRPGPPRTREQELAEEVEYLRAKVAYLEKLHALQEENARGGRRA